MMSDNILSQEEIEALLRGEPIRDEEPQHRSTEDKITDNYLNEMEQDALVKSEIFPSEARQLPFCISWPKGRNNDSVITVINSEELEAELSIHMLQ